LTDEKIVISGEVSNFFVNYSRPSGRGLSLEMIEMHPRDVWSIGERK